MPELSFFLIFWNKQIFDLGARRKNENAVNSRHQQLKVEIEEKYKRNTRKIFHFKLERVFSLLDSLRKAGRADDVPWILKALQGGATALQFIGETFLKIAPILFKALKFI